MFVKNNFVKRENGNKSNLVYLHHYLHCDIFIASNAAKKAKRYQFPLSFCQDFMYYLRSILTLNLIRIWAYKSYSERPDFAQPNVFIFCTASVQYVFILLIVIYISAQWMVSFVVIVQCVISVISPLDVSFVSLPTVPLLLFVSKVRGEGEWILKRTENRLHKMHFLWSLPWS